MKKVKIFIEPSQYGYSAYMEDNDLDYGLIGEGQTIEETMHDFDLSYDGMREYYKEIGKPFEEIEYEFFYDTESFLAAYGKTFSLAGLSIITGVNQAQLGHYLHGRRKPTRKTIDKIQKGVERFARELTAVRFA